MQTRRDQLQAYRFQNRRALAALVKGEPNVLEAPMRRLTVTTLSGILIAILIAAGFAVLALFKPSSGDAWRAGDAVIIDQDTSADYVYLNHVLHPVVNYPSAVLALGATSTVKRVYVSAGDIAGAKRGPTIGIDGIPLTLPSASQLINSSMSVCSRTQAGTKGPQTKVSLLVGGQSAGKSIPANASLLVTSAPGPATTTTPADPGGTTYLLYNGKRFQLGNTLTSQTAVAGELQLNAIPSIAVGRAFLNGVPAGTTLAPPQLTGVGDLSGHVINSVNVRIGELVQATDAKQTYVMLRDGIGPVDEVEAKLLQTLTGLDGRSMPVISTITTNVLGAGTSNTWKSIEKLRADLPQQLPSVPPNAAANEGVCAIYPRGAANPDFAIPAALTQASQGTVTETAVAEAGLADKVVVAPNHAVIGQVIGKGSANFLISDAGRLYPIASTRVLAGFGYGSVKPALLPAQLVSLIQPGPALSQQAALRPVSN